MTTLSDSEKCVLYGAIHPETNKQLILHSPDSGSFIYAVRTNNRFLAPHSSHKLPEKMIVNCVLDPLSNIEQVSISDLNQRVYCRARFEPRTLALEALTGQQDAPLPDATPNLRGSGIVPRNMQGVTDGLSLASTMSPQVSVRRQPIIETSDNILKPTSSGQFVNYEPVLLVQPNPHSWPLQRHPQNPTLSTDPNDPYCRALNTSAMQEKQGIHSLRSRFNGYKYQSADLRDGINNFRSIPGIGTNPNRPYHTDPTFRERAQVSHYNPNSDSLEAGDVAIGEHGHVNVEDLPDLDMRSGRTFGHSHPPGPYTAWEPSLTDHVGARQMPHLQSFVKVPDVAGKPEMDILQFNGAFPPRHYISLPNPQGYPVPPDSPDIPPSPGGSLRYPSFKNPPATYQGPPVAYPGPHGYDSRSPSPEGEEENH
ncbi:hypothetical protein ACFQDN_23135 [Pseudomonas asuensis]|uniref:hypothetical protein n=1 Tax=Pseudomonas asuensis TaxID=1825787 RepID=UPI0016665C44|nr:hypothetical protein [Pseudomonas asuensis]